MDYLDFYPDWNAPGLASALDETAYWSSRFSRLIFDYLPLRRGIDVLDLACGTGSPTLELANMLGPSSRITGADILQPMLERAAFKRDFYGYPNVSFVHMPDDTLLPFPDQSFDLIVSNLGVNNFAQPTAVLAECARVCRSAGQLVITTNLIGHMQEFYDVFGPLLEQRGDSAALERLAANIAHRGSRDSHLALLTAAGFRVTRVIEEQYTFRVLDGSALLRHSLIRIGFLPSWRQVVGPQHERAFFAELEARLNELAAQRGQLALTIPMLYAEAERESAV